VEVGDLVRLREPLNFSPHRKNLLGVIVDINKIKGSYDNQKGRTLCIEYKVSIITNNKAAWYIEDSLELVNESGRSC
jgi:hypothetical protein